MESSRVSAAAATTTASRPLSPTFLLLTCGGESLAFHNHHSMVCSVSGRRELQFDINFKKNAFTTAAATTEAQTNYL